MTSKHLFSALALIIFLCLCPPGARAAQESALHQRLDQVVAQCPSLQGSRSGICVKVLRSGATAYSRNADTPLIPASNLKILVSAAALTFLGPDFTYQTLLLGAAFDPKTGTLPGSLYLQGSGDPSWVEELMDPPDLVLRDFANQLAAMGLHRIQGDLVADDSAFDRELLGRGWKSSYLQEPYAPPCGALSLEGNVVRVTAEPGLVSVIPPSLAIKTDTWVGAGGSGVYAARQGDTISVKGRVPEGACSVSYVPISNPAEFAAGNLAWHLQRLGITIKGRVRSIRAGETSPASKGNILCVYNSHPLVQILTLLNKTSDNFVGQQVLKTLGIQPGKRPGSFEGGFDAIGKLLEQGEIDARGMVLADGCGLSALNRTTARQLAEVLEFMWRGPQGQAFMDTLPAGGEPGTTLKSRLAGLSVRAKTGTINGCTSLSGYCITAYGQTLSFSILQNDLPGSVWAARQAEDRVVKTLSAWKEQI